MEKPPFGAFKSANASLPELPTLQFSSFTAPGFMMPPQPKKAWARRITFKKNPGGSPQHQDLVPLDGVASQQQLHPPLLPAKLRKQQPLMGQKRLVAARLPRDDGGEAIATSRDKQWEFRMPGVVPPAVPPIVDAVPAPSDAETSKLSSGMSEKQMKSGQVTQNARLPKHAPAPARYLRVSPEPSMYIIERKQSHGTIVFKPTGNFAISKTVVGFQGKAVGTMRPFRSHMPPASPTFPHEDGGLLQVEGSAVAGANGLEDETVQAAQALGALEVSVGKERRLKEELARNHKIVLKSFRGVVAAFFAGVRSPSGPKKSLALAKCSVVVHTLVSTIQTYLRWRQSHHYLVLLKQGLSLFASRVALSAQLPTALDPSLLDAALSPSPITNTESAGGTPFSTASGSMHDHVLDSTTIAHLKQLYFDYYDCECFILPGMRGEDDDDDHGSDVQTLDMECRSVHSVIEERNVLLASGGDEAGLLDDELEEEEGCLVESPTTRVPVGSMIFDETVERERIFGADDSSENDSISEEA
jgi:hypothetical protein